MRRLTALSPETLVAQRAMNTIRSAQMGELASGAVFRRKKYARAKNEKYYTPAWVTEALLRQFELRGGGVWEPAAGNGAIVTALHAANLGLKVWADDIAPDLISQCMIGQGNFLLSSVSPAPDIITNPPFGPSGTTAFRFCWHALRLAEYHAGRVAMLMRDDFDSAGGRQQLFKFHPAWHKKVVLTERIRWTNLPQKKAGPSGNHAWYIWDWSRDWDAPATIAYEGSAP